MVRLANILSSTVTSNRACGQEYGIREQTAMLPQKPPTTCD